MAEEAIVINEPYEIAKDFEAGTLLKVVLDDDVPEQQNTCDICALDTKGLTEFCPCARCSDIHFKEIKDHE